VLSALSLLLALSTAAPWSSFRGPNGSGVAGASGFPLELGPKHNVVWKSTVPSETSSPVLTRDRIFLTAVEGRKLATLCFDRARGGLLWRRDVETGRAELLHKLNSPASSTPVTDGENVYVFFGDFGLVSYDREGAERWRVPLGPFSNLHGMAASPVLVDGRVVQVCDQDRGAFILAVDSRTGRTVWRVERPDIVHGFATPTIFRPEGGAVQLVIPGSYWLGAYSVESGEKPVRIHLLFHRDSSRGEFTVPDRAA